MAGGFNAFKLKVKGDKSNFKGVISRKTGDLKIKYFKVGSNLEDDKRRCAIMRKTIGKICYNQMIVMNIVVIR